MAKHREPVRLVLDDNWFEPVKRIREAVRRLDEALRPRNEDDE